MSLLRFVRFLPSAGLALPLTAQATIHVPADVPTIQGAIELAQDGDTVLVASGTYAELVDYLGKAIVVESESGAAATTIDATGLGGPVVTFQSGEGPGSVLRGFTVTGGLTAGTPGAGISCIGGSLATPLIQGCDIRGNRTSAASGGGVAGLPTLEDCRIEGNRCGDGSGGGVFGAPVMRRCLVRGNVAYDGGGLYLVGGSLEDCDVVENFAGEGARGGGIEVAGPGVVLVRCVIARNRVNSTGQYPTSGAGVHSSSSDLLIGSCTITANVVEVPSFYGGPDMGGLHGPARLVNTILRGNDLEEYLPYAPPSAVYSDVEGGLAGLGNFDADALFIDAANGDYRLQLGSPCIDSGAPAAPLDPDGSRADVGARRFTHALAEVRNGTGVNPLLLSSGNPPIVGTSWGAGIHAALVPGTVLSGISIRRSALEPGVPVPQGELLVTGSNLTTSTKPSNGVRDAFVFPIPNDLALLGFEAHAQGFVFTAAGNGVLGNALRILIGQ
jgi:hypothetical protein